MKKKQQIRQKFRDDVFERDDHKCKCCGANDVKLDAHHIVDRNEMPNGGYVKENGITLCKLCHKKAEVWHESDGKVWEEGFHPIDLYNLIGSNVSEATQASERLK